MAYGGGRTTRSRRQTSAGGRRAQRPLQGRSGQNFRQPGGMNTRTRTNVGGSGAMRYNTPTRQNTIGRSNKRRLKGNGHDRMGLTTRISKRVDSGDGTKIVNYDCPPGTVTLNAKCREVTTKDKNTIRKPKFNNASRRIRGGRGR